MSPKKPESKSKKMKSVDKVLSDSVNEKILNECNTLYTNPDNGLVNLAKDLGLKLLAPQKKIYVLLVGNHSAGKSSFINWYIEKHVQKEGVAIETQGITFINHGKKRETLTGNATLHLYPQFEHLRNFEGLIQYLNTEISDSIAKRFPLVTFIDTPGLVDGNMNYAFDVNGVVEWLGCVSDLVFVFFDPIGQALCRRTMTVIAKLGETRAELIHFYLSKADEAGDETDRQRVLMQITQEVCKYPSLNRTCFDIQTIYNPLRAKPTRCVNQIDEAAKEIDRTIQMTVQNTLNQLEKDCLLISQTIERRLEDDRLCKSQNVRSFLLSIVLFIIGGLMPTLLIIAHLATQQQTLKSISEFLGDTAAVPFSVLQTLARPVSVVLPSVDNWYPCGVYLLVTVLVLWWARVLARRQPTLTRRQKRRMAELSTYVDDLIHSKKNQLYQDYLKQSV